MLEGMARIPCFWFLWNPRAHIHFHSMLDLCSFHQGFAFLVHQVLAMNTLLIHILTLCSRTKSSSVFRTEEAHSYCLSPRPRAGEPCALRGEGGSCWRVSGTAFAAGKVADVASLVVLFPRQCEGGMRALLPLLPLPHFKNIFPEFLSQRLVLKNPSTWLKHVTWNSNLHSNFIPQGKLLFTILFTCQCFFLPRT